jgi:hypothetical protein
LWLLVSCLISSDLLSLALKVHEDTISSLLTHYVHPFMKLLNLSASFYFQRAITERGWALEPSALSMNSVSSVYKLVNVS